MVITKDVYSERRLVGSVGIVVRNESPRVQPGKGDHFAGKSADFLQVQFRGEGGFEELLVFAPARRRPSRAISRTR
jgi:hypothetical protein